MIWKRYKIMNKEKEENKIQNIKQLLIIQKLFLKIKIQELIKSKSQNYKMNKIDKNINIIFENDAIILKYYIIKLY